MTNAGAKYHKASESVRLISRDGKIHHVEDSSDVNLLSEEIQEMYHYVTEVHNSFFVSLLNLQHI